MVAEALRAGDVEGAPQVGSFDGEREGLGDIFNYEAEWSPRRPRT